MQDYKADSWFWNMKSRILRSVGALLFFGAILGVAYPLWWQHRQAVDGAQEIRRLSGAVASRCARASSFGPGVLRIPAVAVVAPVLEGTSGAVLAVSVGHDLSSPWPGEHGISILEAHDVGYFASNQLLRSGDVVTYTRACETYVYRVVGHYVLHPGQTITSPGPSGLVLDSCWPTNALWFTPDRLIVTAVLTNVRKIDFFGAVKRAVPLAAQLPRSIPTPPNLFDQGWLAGTLTFTGSPALAWKDGPAPLLWESRGLQAFSALRIAEQTHALWTSVLAPGISIPSIIGEHYSSGTPVNVVEYVKGTKMQSVTVATKIQGVPISVTSTPGAKTLRVIAIHT